MASKEFIDNFLNYIKEKYEYEITNYNTNNINIRINQKKFFKFKKELFIWITDNSYKILSLHYNEKVCNVIIAKLVQGKLEYLEINFLFTSNNLSALFVYYYIKEKIFPSGFSFSMTGPDGSGKTTLLTQLEDTFSKIYREVELHHFRPTVIPRIAELFKKSGLKKEVDENYDKPHRGGKTGKLSSWFRLFYYILDYIIGYYKIVKPVLFRRGVIIFDRYYTDIISDSKRSRIYLNYKTIFSLRVLVPKMNYNFIISVEPEKILQRKQELTREQIDDIYEKLEYICANDSSYTLINNDNNPQIAVNEIIDFILTKQDLKYRKFFK